MFKIHYAKKDLGMNDIPCLKFSTAIKRHRFLQDTIIGSRNTVFILAINYNKDDSLDSVFVFDLWNCVRWMDSSIVRQKTIYLQEYTSYEEAYKVALDMKETNKMCYEDSNLSKVTVSFKDN